MPFCREDPCLLPNIRARSRGCPSRFRCTSADGGMRACFCRRRAVRAARNGVSCKRAPIPRFGQRHRYIRKTTSRVMYALSALAVVLIAQTSAERPCLCGNILDLNWLLQPIPTLVNYGLAKKLTPQLDDQVWPPGVIGTCATALLGLSSVRASIGAAVSTLRASRTIHKRLDVIEKRDGSPPRQ